MLRYALFILLLINWTSSTELFCSPIQEPVKSALFDELNQYENLIEETELTTTKVKEIKISAPTHYALQAASWLLVQYLTLSQKVAAWCTILVNGSEDNDNE
jgi:hypothetical protein